MGYQTTKHQLVLQRRLLRRPIFASLLGLAVVFISPITDRHVLASGFLLADSTAQLTAESTAQLTDESTAQLTDESTAQVASVKQSSSAAKASEKLAKSVASAHKGVFFDNDFSYVLDPNYSGHEWGDGLKRRCLTGGGWFDIGGENRFRYHGERNHRGLGLTGVDDDFLLRRNRLYADLHFNQDIRLFGEMIDADSSFETFAPRPIEVNRFDMLNLFVDVNLLSTGSADYTARMGRQELMFGSQRVVSPLDWSNTRRKFDGVRVMRRSDNLSIDSFWTHPVRVNDNRFDASSRDEEFMGVYLSDSSLQQSTTDFYALRYLNGNNANDFQVNTLGVRNQGESGEYLWDIEAAIQFGDNTDQSSRSAGAFTAGLGRKFSDAKWSPTLWLYYDWASGDDEAGSGNGYDHLFPLAHKYNGFMDLFGRRNLEDVNVLLTVAPTKKLKLLAWYHYFFLENKNDTPYSVVMTPFNASNAPGSADLGHEIDFLATWNFTSRNDLALGFSHFFAGDYYRTTAGVPFDGDASFFYTQWSTRY